MKLFTAVQDLGFDGDYAKALAILDELGGLLDAKSAAPQRAESDEARWLNRRGLIEDLYLQALKEQPGKAGQLRAVLAFADGKAEAKHFDKALRSLDNLEKLLRAPFAANGPAAAAQKDWQAACTEVKNQLRKVQGKILKAKHTSSARAVARLQSVVKNLSLQPSTQREVVELERWIADNKVITKVEKPNPWGLTVTVRESLLPVLARLKPLVPA